MDPELQKQLAAYLQAIADTAQQGAGFVMEQAPLVVQEKILLGRVTLTTWFVICAVAIVPLFRFAHDHVKLVREINRERGERWRHNEEVLPALLASVSFLASAACVIAALALIREVAVVWVAPRLYILEWVMGLVK